MRAVLTGLVFAGLACCDELRLSLHDSIHMAITNNLDVEIARTDSHIANANLWSASGAFDPRLRAQTSVERSTTPVGSILESPRGRVTDRVFGQSLTYQQNFAWQGLFLDAGIENSRRSTDNPYFSLTPFYSPQLRATVNLPLLRGRRTDEGRTAILVRRKSRDITAAEFGVRVSAIAYEVERVYWSLVAAGQDVEVANRSLERVQRQVSIVGNLVQQGELAASELRPVEAALDERRQALKAAGQQQFQGETALKELLSRSADDPIWGSQITLIDQQPELRSDLETDLRMAGSQRPEVAVLAARREASRAEIALAADALRPRLDLAVTFRSQSLAGRLSSGPGTLFPVGGEISPKLIGGLPRALGQIARVDYPSVQASLTFELPIRNRKAVGELVEREAQGRRIGLERDRLLLRFAAEIRRAWNDVAAARERRQLLARSLENYHASVESEVRRLQAGESGNLNVTVRQNDLVAAESRAVNASQMANEAVAEARRAAGRYLSDFGITIAP
ncbi:MAG: TolC family protein [Bryobacteraceae bacterium]|nr:TolC family protein [Bryobacteraceae bacterium]